MTPTLPFARTGLVAALAVLLVSTAARAQDADQAPRPLADPAVTAAGDGAFLPQTLSARVGKVRALMIGSGGYDSSRRGPLANAAAEVAIWGPLALRVETVYSNDTNRMRPSVGARAQLLRQDRHGVDGALTVFYKTEGFTEAEGEIETFASFGRRFQSVSLVGNLVYGQDSEGNERDGEVRAAAFHQHGAFAVGLDSRLRFAIGTQHGRAATVEPTFDFAGGPVVTAAAGSFAVFAEAGPSMFGLASASMRYGLEAFGGLGAAF
jgi:hypothetical protein